MLQDTENQDIPLSLGWSFDWFCLNILLQKMLDRKKKSVKLEKGNSYFFAYVKVNSKEICEERLYQSLLEKIMRLAFLLGVQG